VLRHIQDTRDVSWRAQAKKLFFYGSYCLYGMLVSGSLLFKVPPIDSNSIVNTHVGTCHQSMWAILVLKFSSTYLTFSVPDRDGGCTSLMTVVYRDGESFSFCRWPAAPLNLDIAVIYYLYLFGRFLYWEWMCYFLMMLVSPLMYQYHHCKNPFRELRSYLGLRPYFLTSNYSKVTKIFCSCKQHICNFKQILIQARVERMLHSIFTSRVVLHIRAQAADSNGPDWTVVLTELTTIHHS